ncbi:MAG: CRISPR-associated protein Cas4 [bacterium]|nr:CRISPR-associated protein Cas4 [bacterium]
MITLTGSELLLTIKDLVDFVECPRILYWSYLRPNLSDQRKDPLSHETALLYKDQYDPILTDLLIQNGIQHIERYVGVELRNKIIHGKIDVLVKDGSKQYPIYIKNAKECKSLSYFLPVYAYAWLINDTYGTVCEKGFIYYPSRQELESVYIGQAELAVAEATAESARNIVSCGILPDTLHYNPRKCLGCKYRLFCNELPTR